MKKQLSGLLALWLLIGMLLGCTETGSRNEPISETTPAQTAAETQAATPERTPMPEITKSEHRYERKYDMYFKTHVLETERCTVQVADLIFTEELIFRLAEAINDDLKMIGEHMEETPQHVTVYAVNHPLTGQPLAVEDHVFCSPEDIETGAYRGALCGACYGIETPWKQYGLQTVLFGTLDETGLQKYYADRSHMYAASCSAVYLSPLSADDETLEMTRKTAASITAFVMESGGLDALRSVVSTSEVLADWQAHIGIKTQLVLPTEDADVACMQVESDIQYLYDVRLNNFLFCIEEGAFVQTANETYIYLCQFFQGMQGVWYSIRTDAPAYLDRAEERFKEQVTVFILRSVTGRYSQKNNVIKVSKPDHTWREIVHLVLNCKTYRSDLWWQRVAIAQHFSMHAWNACWPRSEEAYFSGYRQWLMDEYGAEKGEAFATLYQAVYRSLREKDTVTSQGMLSNLICARALGIAMLLMPDNPFRDYLPISGSRDSGDKSTVGDGLKHEEALAFFDYLLETYGKETVMDSYMDGRSIEHTYGKSYPELYQEFYTYLAETYGYLLNDMTSI